MEWEEKGVIGDADPMVLIRKVSASELAQRRSEAFASHPGLREAYLREYEEQNGSQAFLNAAAELSAAEGQPDQSLQVLPATGLADGIRTGGCRDFCIRRVCMTIPRAGHSSRGALHDA